MAVDREAACACGQCALPVYGGRGSEAEVAEVLCISDRLRWHVWCALADGARGLRSFKEVGY